MNKLFEPKWAAGVGAALLLTACGGAGGPGADLPPTDPPPAEAVDDEGSALPTPLPGIEIGDESASAAKATPEETWNSYVVDTIAEQIANRRQKINILERYEDPDITAQNLGGLLTNIELLQDRTTWNISGNNATSFVDYDIRVTYANGDTDTRTCRYNVGLQRNEEDQVWYVINPSELQVFAVCS